MEAKELKLERSLRPRLPLKMSLTFARDRHGPLKHFIRGRLNGRNADGKIRHDATPASQESLRSLCGARLLGIETPPLGHDLGRMQANTRKNKTRRMR